MIKNKTDKIQQKNLKTLKIINIVQIIVCSLSIIVAIATIVFILIAYNKTNNPNEMYNLIKNVNVNEFTENNGEITNVWKLQYNTINLFNTGLNITMFFSVLNLIFCLFALYCSIIIFFNISKSQIKKQLTILCTIACFTSLLSIHIIEFILFIIIAYKLNHHKKEKIKDTNLNIKKSLISNLLHKESLNKNKEIHAKHLNNKLNNKNYTKIDYITLFKKYINVKKRILIRRQKKDSKSNIPTIKGKHIK